MSMNDTPVAQRTHIGFFGRRNAGKSSLLNAVTGQDFAVVSSVPGTTTDPVQKTMELLPLGPVVIIDTPGIDDRGELGEMRVKKAMQMLNRIDIGILTVDINEGMSDFDKKLVDAFEKKEIPYIIVYNKADIYKGEIFEDEKSICVSAEKNINIVRLKEKIGRLKAGDSGKKITEGLISSGDTALLVTPLDSAAPKGRLILPQQQTIRDILDSDAMAIVTKETELEKALENYGDKIKIVITDSQVFQKVSEAVPENIPLTSFSILMARYKGFLKNAVRDVKKLDELLENDTILICEGCTHHRQCGDIGTVKLPKWLEEYTGKKFQYEFTSGGDFPEDVTKYSMIIHCGGCMLNEREIRYRMKTADDAGVPFTNYGTVIAFLKGILKRSIEPISEIKELIK